MRLGLVAVAAWVAVLSACSPSVEVPGVSSSEGTMRYLALGDSTRSAKDWWPTAVGLPCSHPPWPKRGGGYALTMVARTGWTAGELRSEMRGPQLVGPFVLISLQVGVNDQYRGRPVEEFNRDLARLLEEVRQLAGARPERGLVVSIPDWSESPFGLDSAARNVLAEIDAFNAELARSAGEFGFRFVDVTDPTSAAGMGSDMFTPDGLHYSRAMNERWVQRILPEACAAVRGG